MHNSFLNKLNNDELIDLINYCIEKKNNNIELALECDGVEEIFITMPEDEYNQNDDIIYVHTPKGIEHMNRLYVVSDFNMHTKQYDEYYSYPEINYDNELRKFMTKKFGQKYILALFKSRVDEVYKEINELQKISKVKTK